MLTAQDMKSVLDTIKNPHNFLSHHKMIMRAQDVLKEPCFFSVGARKYVLNIKVKIKSRHWQLDKMK